MIAGNAVDLMVVKNDHVRLPGRVIRVLKQRGIGGQPDDILISFYSKKERRFRQGALHGSDRIPAVYRVFPQENLRPFSVIAVEHSSVFQEEFRRVIIVLIRVVRWKPFPLRMAVGKIDHLGEGRFQCPVEQRVTLMIFRAPVFVPDLHIFKPERFSVPVLRPQAAIWGFFSPKRVFQGMKRFLQILSGHLFRKASAMPRLAAHPAVADIHRFHLQIFAKLQIFMEAQAVRRAVMPHQLTAWPFPDRPDGPGKA